MGLSICGRTGGLSLTSRFEFLTMGLCFYGRMGELEFLTCGFEFLTGGLKFLTGGFVSLWPDRRV